ncbi:facilitated trehalose transporter Tret1-like [Coccinella septempunctata]|uniref:facilitated trehalose transporter Tret1-like n=1 Tax=Coccinella septempunctata TaxID=41139 RepID=UPI001D060CF8|nr:facilitated trehalose transporter Tret1-like [Coccinella septempunctata]
MKLVFTTFIRENGSQLVAVFLGTLNAISDGMQYGWTAPSIPVLRSPGSPITITHTKEVWLELCYMIGGFVGLPFSIFLVDFIGRKKTVLFSSVVGLMGWISIAIAHNIYYLYAGRLLLGVTADIAFTASPVYISEIAHQGVRGFLAGQIYLMMLVGIIIIYSIGPWLPIYGSAIVGCCLLVIQLVLFPLMPESPYYLIYIGQNERAEKSLKFFRGNIDVSAELQEIKSAVERQKSEKGRPEDLFRIDSNRKACLIMILLNYTQHFAGVSALVMNLHSILIQADSNVISADHVAILFPSLMLVSATIATVKVDDCGRKILLLVSGIITTVTLFILGAFFQMQSMKFQTQNYSWIPFVVIMFYAVGIKFGLAIVPIVITAELFPAKVKGMGMALADFVYILSSITSVYLYQWININYTLSVSFFVFGTLCALSTIIIHFYVPETKGKTLEEIQMILKNVRTVDVQNTKL